MTAEETTAVERALLDFRQIETSAGFIAHKVSDQRDLCDAIGGLMSLAGYAANRLDAGFPPGRLTARELSA